MTIERNGLLWRLGFQHQSKERKPVMKALEVEQGIFMTCRTCTATLSVGQIDPDARGWDTVATGVAYCKPMDAYNRETGRQRALHHLKLSVRSGEVAQAARPGFRESIPGIPQQEAAAEEQFVKQADEALQALRRIYGARPRKNAAARARKNAA